MTISPFLQASQQPRSSANATLSSTPLIISNDHIMALQPLPHRISRYFISPISACNDNVKAARPLPLHRALPHTLHITTTYLIDNLPKRKHQKQTSRAKGTVAGIFAWPASTSFPKHFTHLRKGPWLADLPCLPSLLNIAMLHQSKGPRGQQFCRACPSHHHHHQRKSTNRQSKGEPWLAARDGRNLVGGSKLRKFRFLPRLFWALF